MHKRTLAAILGTIFLLSMLGACLFNAGKPTPSPEPTTSVTATPVPPRPTFTPIPPTPTRPPTATPSPLPSPTHTASVPTLRVTADLLNVRETPSLDSKILARVKEGDTLPILGRNIAGDWLMIQLSDGRQGWVALQWVQASVPPTTLPIRETQVRNTPTPIRLTPVATASPTTAPILALRPAPKLVEPHDGQTFGKRGPLQLTWTWDTALGADEYYVVTIAYPHQQSIWHDTHWVKERAFTPPAYLAELITGDRRCKWWVVVMRQTGKNTDGSPAGQAISQTSETRTFLWGD